MNIRFASVFILAVAVTAPAQSPDLRTRAEITNYEETSSYADLERIGKEIGRAHV